MIGLCWGRSPTVWVSPRSATIDRQHTAKGWSTYCNRLDCSDGFWWWRWLQRMRGSRWNPSRGGPWVSLRFKTSRFIRRVGQHHHPAAFLSLRKLVTVICGHVSNANSISSAFSSQRWPKSSASRGPKFCGQHSYRIQYQRRKTEDRLHMMRGNWNDSVLA